VTEIDLLVNGCKVKGSVEPRMHLADFLRENLHLTGTHLRCEQGVCGACTLLIDGALARSCIAYAVLCQEAEVTTIEGLEQDPIIGKLRDAFSREHGLQCGFCTPGMLITARDIVRRLPDADEQRVRLELSGNLCRCTGYAGIVRAICLVLEEYKAVKTVAMPKRVRLGPVGARQFIRMRDAVKSLVPRERAPAPPAQEFADLGLGSRPPNMQSQIAFTIRRPDGEVWAVLADIERVARCVPGTSLTSPPSNGHVQGRVAIKLGPISTSFDGAALIVRDEQRQKGAVYGAGRDRLSGSNARAEVAFVVSAADAETTRVELSVRALLAGPLGQFGRSQIVQDLIARLASEFARRLEYTLEHGSEDVSALESVLKPWAPLRYILLAKIRSLFSFFSRKRAADDEGP
jgi:aerobic carbon-monoxide dehydrogenase small subunit